MKNFLSRQVFYAFCILGILTFSGLSRRPIYGKFKFLFLDTFGYFYGTMDSLNHEFYRFNSKHKLRSDPVTEYSLYASFGVDIRGVNKFRGHRPLSDYGLFLDTFIRESIEKDNICVINLKGFQDTFVPRLTGHWDPEISNTSRLYRHLNYRGKKLAIIIENHYKGKCIVIADKEIPWEERENFRYHSPNVNYSLQQQDAHILQFRNPNGSVYNILVDAGMELQVNEKLLDYLAKNEIYRIDEIFISHPHPDHYYGLFELIKFGIPIRKVWTNIPKKENCDLELPWGCNYEEYSKLRALMKEKKIEFQEIINLDPSKPRVVYKDAYNTLSVVFASSPIHPQLGNMDINDLSMIMRLETNGKSYLFTGDLNKPLSNFLKDNPAFRADILKVPHHGTEGVASNEFFDTVNPKIGIVPAPSHLWCNERSSRIRKYFTQSKAKMYISGFHGDILIRHFDSGEFRIKTEVEPKKVCE